MNNQLSLDGSLQLVVAWTQGQATIARKIKMSDHVTNQLKSYAHAAVDSLTEPTPYTPDADMEDNSHMEATRDESLDTELIDKLAEGASLDLATDHELRTRNLKCHALVATSPTEKTIYVRKRSPIQLAKKSLLATLVNGRLDDLETPLFAFDNRYDAIVTKDLIYILDKKSFEGLFKDSPAVLQKTMEWIEDVSKAVSFSDDSVDVLNTVLKRNSILRNKFLAVKKKRYLSKITPGALRIEMSKYGYNPVELMEGDDLKVTEQNVKTILRLLNEDIFTGSFSNEHYAASSKRTIG